MRLGMAILFLGWNASAQQPFLQYGGTQNAASRTPAGLPGSALPRGGIVVILGRNLGPASPVQATELPLSQELGGSRLELTAEGRTYPLYPFFVSSGEIDAIVPSGAPVGKASLRLRRGTLVSNPLPVRVETTSLGLFTVNFSGYGPAIATNHVSSSVQPLNSSMLSASPGQQVTFFGTGLGPAAAQADNALPESGNLPPAVEVYVGGERAEVLYSGRSPTFPGLDLISIRVPPSAPAGCYVPVIARAGGVVSNAVSISVSPQGQACEDSHSPLSAALRQGGKTLRFFADRLNYLSDLFVRTPFEYQGDSATLQSIERQPNPYAYELPDALPPPGTCTLLQQKGLFVTDLHPAFQSAGAVLAPGLGATLRAAVTKALEPVPRAGGYQAYGNSLEAANPLLYRDGATISVTGQGFSFQLPTTGGLQWPGRSSVSIVDSRRPLIVSWTGGASSDLAVVAAASASTANDASAIAICVCEAAKGSFTAPEYILGALPRQRAPFALEEAALAVGLIKRSAAATIPVSGYAAALGIESVWSARSVFVQ